MKYIVEVTFETRGWRHIEANSPEEAQEIAEGFGLPSFHVESEECTDMDVQELE
jgi:hypothetical protein